MADYIYRQLFTIEVFSRAAYPGGRQAEPDDGTWRGLEEFGSVQKFNTEDEAIQYLQKRFPWIHEHKPYSQEPQIEWRVVKTEIRKEVVNTNVLQGLFLNPIKGSPRS